MPAVKSALSLFLLLMACNTVAAADQKIEQDQAREWLRKMSRALHTLDYEGTFVYRDSDRLQTMQIFHTNDGRGGEKERLVTLNGASREVIRDREKVTCILPDSGSVVVEDTGPGRPFPLNLPARLEQLDVFYTLKVEGEERIAGQPALRISIAPKDAYRYGHNLWLAENGLLLQSELVNEGGDMVEQLMFTELRVHDRLPQELLQPQSQGKDLIWYEQKELGPGQHVDIRWRVDQLPPGFKQDVHRKHFLPTIMAPVEHLVFSDGLATVSVFIDNQRSGKGFLGPSRMGAVNAFARMVADHRVTVVGEVPAETVKMIADSIVHEGSPDDD